MSRILVLVRHAKPERSAASGRDFDRELTPGGLAAVQGAYPTTFSLLARLLPQGVRPRVWSSPAVRARQTAAVAADALGVDAREVELHETLYAQDEAAFMDELDASGESCVVAVGHIPFMESLPRLLGGVDLGFGPGAVCALALPDDEDRPADLLFFVQGPAVGEGA